MARLLATKGHKATAIMAKMDIPIEVAEDAFDKPLPKDVEFATALPAVRLRLRPRQGQA